MATADSEKINGKQEHGHAMHSKIDAHKGSEDREKKNKSGEDSGSGSGGSKSLLYALGIVLVIAILLGGIIAYNKIFANKPIVYNHYTFTKFEGNKWMTEQLIRGQLYDIPFYYNPEQVLNVTLDRTTIDLMRQLSANPNSTVYITFDPGAPSQVVVAGVEYARILGKSYNIYNMNVTGALTVAAGNSSAPIITCANQSPTTIVIYQYIGVKNDIRRNNYCILLESESANDSLRVADAFAFNLLNIIQ